MKFKTVKLLEDLPKVEGYYLDITKEDGAISIISITDKETGSTIRITKGNTYTDALKISVQEPNKTKQVWVLFATTEDGLSIEETLNSQTEANNRLNDLICKYPVMSSAICERTVEVEDTEV